MRHQRAVKKLGRTASHRKAMLRNLVTSLIREERVVTTHARARVARSVAERFITRARKGGLANRREVARDIHDEAALRKLFNELGPRFADRPGGYTRILRMGQRDGDAAHTSMLELLGAPAVKDKVDKEPKKGKKGRREREAEEQAAQEAAETPEKETKEPKEKKGATKGDAKAKAEEKAAKKERRDAEKAKRKARRAAGAGEKSAGGGREGARKKDDKGGGPGGKGGKSGGGARRRIFGRKSG